MAREIIVRTAPEKPSMLLMPVRRSTPASRTMFSLPRARLSIRYDTMPISAIRTASAPASAHTPARISPSHTSPAGVSSASNQPLKPNCAVVSV